MLQQEICRTETAHALEPVRLIVGDRWKVSILQQLMDGPQRLLDLKQHIRYVSHRVLVEELAELEQIGVLTKNSFSRRAPLDAEYALTEKGRGLQSVFDSMLQWSRAYL